MSNGHAVVHRAELRWYTRTRFRPIGSRQVLPHVEKFGIYLNPAKGKVVRITSPYWFPPEPEWVYVTSEVNAPLTKIRDVIQEKGLSEAADTVVWGRIPSKE